MPQELAQLVTEFLHSIRTAQDFHLLNTSKLKLLLELIQNRTIFTKTLRTHLSPVIQTILSFHLKNANEGEAKQVADILLALLAQYFGEPEDSGGLVELLPLLPAFSAALSSVSKPVCMVTPP